MALGSSIGAGAGAALGSIIPGLGTAVGGAIGGALGSIGDAIFGGSSEPVVPTPQEIASQKLSEYLSSRNNYHDELNNKIGLMKG